MSSMLIKPNGDEQGHHDDPASNTHATAHDSSYEAYENQFPSDSGPRVSHSSISLGGEQLDCWQVIPTVKTALNADVVGYSRLMADDFEATKRVMDDYERLVSSHVTDNQGLLVNFVGDNFMALFDDPAAAMKAAISISAEIESRNSGLASIRQVRFRMGLDLGPASQSGNQWFGDALNIAARIQAIASEGGVSVSGEVYRGLDEPELRFTSRGRKQLKNIPEQIEVFEYSGLPSAAAGGQAAAGISLADPTIALLPIHTELVDEDLAPLAQIIRDELLHRMSGIHSLNVVDADGSTEASEDPSHYNPGDRHCPAGRLSEDLLPTDRSLNFQHRGVSSVEF